MVDANFTCRRRGATRGNMEQAAADGGASQASSPRTSLDPQRRCARGWRAASTPGAAAATHVARRRRETWEEQPRQQQTSRVKLVVHGFSKSFVARRSRSRRPLAGPISQNEREGQDPPCASAAPAASTGTAAVPDASGEPGEPSRAECERVEGEFVGRRALLLPACYRRGGRATSTATDGSTNGSGSSV